MNLELQKTHEQILEEINWIWSRVVQVDYTHIAEHTGALLLLVKHAEQLIERET